MMLFALGVGVGIVAGMGLGVWLISWVSSRAGPW